MSERFVPDIHEQVIAWLRAGDPVDEAGYDIDASAANMRRKLDTIAADAVAAYPDDDDQQAAMFGHWAALAWQDDDWLVASTA